MTLIGLLLRNLVYFWRTNIPVALGCFVGSSVLSGALLVGDSMRGSLKSMTLERLGNIDKVVVSDRFFTTQTAKNIQAALQGAGEKEAIAAPAILIRGTVSNPEGKHAYKVNIIGTSPEFWKLFPTAFGFEILQSTAHERAIVNRALAERLQAKDGDEVTAFFERASSAHRETVLGERRETVRPMPVVIESVIDDRGAGRFSLEATQQVPLNLYVSLELLAKAIEQPGRANALLISAGDSVSVEGALSKSFTLDDYGLSIVGDEPAEVAWLESRRLVLDEAVVAAAKMSADNAVVTPVLAALATDIRKESAAVPYSVVSAIDESAPLKIPPGGAILNRWTADRLNAKAGDRITIDYFEVLPDGNLGIKSANFTVANVLPIEGFIDDRHFAPTYPGVTDANDFRSWKAPFDIDNRKIKKEDDDYWSRYKTTPKVFVRLDEGKKLFAGRFGDISSVRIEFQGNEIDRTKNLAEFKARLSASINLVDVGFAVQPIRKMQLEASSGSTPFDVLFLAFSFFIIISAGLIVALMFRLNAERRASQAGLLLAVGTTLSRTRRLLLAEGLVLSTIGAILGCFGAVGYAKLMIAGLTSRWADAVNTPFISFHATPTSLLIGALVSVALAMAAIWWSVRSIGRTRVPQLLSRGFTFDRIATKSSPSPLFAIAGLLALAGLATAFFAPRDNVGAFFGAGAMLLASTLFGFAGWLARKNDAVVQGAGTLALIRLGVRNLRRQRSRSILTASLIAFATFIIASVSAFQHDDEERTPKRESGDGGFALIGESASPVFSPLTFAQRINLNLSDETSALLKRCDAHALRVRSGDDASCLNIYQPQNPTLLGVDRRFRERDGFVFAGLPGDATDNERRNPWQLLTRDLGPRVLPVIGDKETLDYILKLGIGSELNVTGQDGKPVVLRVVGALGGSIFQGQLIAAEEKLTALFPSVSGFKYFLLDCQSLKPEEIKDLGSKLELDLTDYGLEITTTARRLASYHAVANTYIATFQTLGGLGLLLGTLGLAAVVLRNVFERRGELALMRALGFQSTAISGMILAENAAMLLLGVGVGTVCAAIAVAPHWISRTEPSNYSGLAGMLLAVIIVGLAVGVLGARIALRERIIPALRSE